MQPGTYECKWLPGAETKVGGTWHKYPDIRPRVCKGFPIRGTIANPTYSARPGGILPGACLTDREMGWEVFSTGDKGRVKFVSHESSSLVCLIFHNLTQRSVLDKMPVDMEMLAN